MRKPIRPLRKNPYNLYSEVATDREEAYRTAYVKLKLREYEEAVAEYEKQQQAAAKAKGDAEKDAEEKKETGRLRAAALESGQTTSSYEYKPQSQKPKKENPQLPKSDIEDKWNLAKQAPNTEKLWQPLEIPEAGSQPVKVWPTTFYSEEEQNEFFDNRARVQAELLFSDEIRKAELQRDAAIAEYDFQRTKSYGTGPMASMSAANLPAYETAVEKANDNLLQVLKKRDRYLLTLRDLTNTNNIFSGQLANTIKQSDAYLDQKFKTNTAFNVAIATKRLGTLDYHNKLLDYSILNNKLLELGKRFMELLDYLETKLMLPKKITDLPKDLQPAAIAAFTKNGKLLLDDEEFVDQFNANMVVKKSQFDQLSNIAQGLAMTPVELSKEYLMLKKAELEILKDLEKTNYKPDKSFSQYLKYTNYGEASRTQHEEAVGKYDSAIRYIDKALRYKALSDAVLRDNENSSGGILTFGRAVWEGLATAFNNNSIEELLSRTLNLWTGLPDIIDSRRVLNVADKLESGKPITDGENTLLQALALENIADSQWGKILRDSTAYRWGQITAESIRFMADFVATRGAHTAILKGTKTAAKGLAKSTSKVLENAAMKNLAKFGKSPFLAKTRDFLTTLTGDALYAALLTNTAGLRNTAQDINEYRAGNLLYSQDVFGNIQPEKFNDRMSSAGAFWKTEGLNFIENFSEMMGEWGIGRGIHALSKRLPGLGKFLRNVEFGYKRNLVNNNINAAKNYLQNGILENNTLLAASKLSEYIPRIDRVFNSHVLKAGQFHGFFGEVSEEYYAILLQHLFNLQKGEQWGDLWNDVKSQSLDIWGGIAASTALLSSIGVGIAARNQLRYDNAVANLRHAYGEKNATEIQKALLFADPEYMVDTLMALQGQYGFGKDRTSPERIKTFFENVYDTVKNREAWKNVSKEDALMEYFKRLVELRGAVYGETIVKKAVGEKAHYIQNAARKAGYATPSYKQLQTIGTVQRMIAEDVNQLLGSEEDRKLGVAAIYSQKYGSNILNVLKAIQNEEILVKVDSNQDKQAQIELLLNGFTAYHNATSGLEAIDDALNMLSEDRAKKVAERVKGLENVNTKDIRVLTKLVQGAEGLEDRNIFWIDGDIKTQVNQSDIEYDETILSKKDKDAKILVSDGAGMYQLVTHKDLKGWKIGDTIPTLSFVTDAYNSELRKERDFRNKYLAEFQQPVTGEQRPLGDKNITILDVRPGGSIVYSIQNEDGSGTEIYSAENIESLNKLLDKIQQGNAQNITNMFEQDAAKLVEMYKEWDAEEAEYLKRLQEGVVEQEENQMDVLEDDADEPDEADKAVQNEGAAQNEKQEVSEQPIKVEPLVQNPQPVELNPNPQPVENEVKEEPAVKLDKKPKARKSRTKLIQYGDSMSFDQLKEFVEEYKNIRIATTGYHHIIEINEGGKTRWRLAKRVHDVLKPIKLKDSEDEAFLKNYSRLLDAVVVEGTRYVFDNLFKTAKDVVYELANDHYDNKIARQRFIDGKIDSLKLDKYKEYLEKFPEDLDEVITALAHILSDSAGPSVIAGQLYDTIKRAYLDDSTDNISYDDENLTVYYFGKDAHISNFISKDAFNIIIEGWDEEVDGSVIHHPGLKDVKAYYKSIGWRLCTTPHILYGYFSINDKTELIAGEPDCLALDKDGHVQIIDFKTYNGDTRDGAPYHYFDYEEPKLIGTGTEITNDLYIKRYDSDLGLLVQLYAEQQAYYKALLVQNGITPSGAYLQFSEIQYSKDEANTHIFINEELAKKTLFMHDGLPILEDVDVEKIDDDKNPLRAWVQDSFLTKVRSLVANSATERVKQLVRVWRERLKVYLDNGDLSESAKQKIKEFIDLANQFNRNKRGINYARVEAEFNICLERAEEEINYKKEFEQKLDNAIQTLQRAHGLAVFNPVEFLKSLIDELIAAAFPYYKKTVSGDLMMVWPTLTNDQELDSGLTDLIKQTVNSMIVAEWALKQELYKDNQAILYYANQLYDFIPDENQNKYFHDTIMNAVNSVLLLIDADIADEQDVNAYRVTGLSYGSEDGPWKDRKDTIRNSTATSKSGIVHKLNEFTSDYAFLSDARFFIQRKESSKKEGPQFEVVVEYDVNGETLVFTPINVWFGQSGSKKKGEKFTEAANKLRQMLNDKIKDGERVKINNKRIKRSFGDFIVSENPEPLTQEKITNLTGLLDIHDLKYNSFGYDIGITRVVASKNGIARVVVLTPQGADGGRKTLYLYTGNNKKSAPMAGGVVLLHKVVRDETKDFERSQENIIPINLESATFNKKTATFVASLLKLIIQDGEDAKYKDTDISVKEIIEYFIPYGENVSKKGKTLLHVYTKGSTVFLRGKIKGAVDSGKLINEVPFDFNYKDADGKTGMDYFIDHLVNNGVKVNIDEEFMKLDSVEDRGPLTFGDTGIKIDETDEDISGVAWLIKNKFLLTSFLGLHAPLISFVESDDFLDEEQTPEEIEQTVVDKDVDEFDSAFELFDKEQNNERPGEDPIPESTQPVLNSIVSLQDADGTIDEEQVRQRTLQLCGDVTVKFQDEVLKFLANGVAVAECGEDMFRYSRLAKNGTEWHECFHRILEFLVDEKTRKNAYKRYRRKFGQSLTDKEITEKAANEFWWFVENRPTISWRGVFSKDVLQNLKHWYDFFTKIGSYGLYKLYKNAAAGKYANAKITEEARQRWRELTKNTDGVLYSTFSANGINFEYIKNNNEYQAVLLTIVSQLLDPLFYPQYDQVLDPTGKDLKNIHLTADMIRRSKLFIGSNGILRDGRYTKEARQKLSEALGLGVKDKKVVKVNDNLERVLDDILRKLGEFSAQQKKLETKFTKKGKHSQIQKVQEQEPVVADELGEEVRIAASPIEYRTYDAQSNEFEPIVRASARVKFFFARIPDMRPESYITPEGQVRIASVQKTNEAGLPLYMDFKEAWAMVLNKVHDCRTIVQLRDRLKLLSLVDLRFVKVWENYEKMLKKAFGENYLRDDQRLGAIKDNNAAGLAVDIAQSVCLAKNVPYVAQSYQTRKDSEYFGAVRIMEASMEYQVRDIKKQWSSAFNSGKLDVIGRKQNGDLYVTDSLLKKLKDVHTVLSAILKLFSPSSDVKKGWETFVLTEKLLKTYKNKDNGGKLDILYENGNPVYEKKLWKFDDIDVNDHVQLQALKKALIGALNALGITIEVEDIDFYLQDVYGSVDTSAVKSFFSGRQGIGLTTIRKKVGSIINSVGDGRSTFQYSSYRNIWSYQKGDKTNYNSMLDTLATAKFRRSSAEIQLSYLTILGKRVYAMSEHNPITDILDDLKDLNSDTLDNLLADPYYRTKTGKSFSGSRALSYLKSSIDKYKRAIDTRRTNQTEAERANEVYKAWIELKSRFDQIKFNPVPGLKTDERGSRGVEYLEFSEQDDVVTKFGLLAHNDIIMEPNSDKTTWGAVHMPSEFGAFGIDWAVDDSVDTHDRNQKAILKLIDQLKLGTHRITATPEEKLLKLNYKFDDSVIDLFIQYAQCEYDSAVYQLLHYKDYFKNGKHDSELINNFDSAYIESVDKLFKKEGLIQGAMLSTFTGIIDDDGNFVSFVNIKGNDDTINIIGAVEQENLNKANELFFSQSLERKRELMNRLLSYQLQKELEYLDSIRLLSLDKDTMIVKNNGLDIKKVRRLKKVIDARNELDKQPDKRTIKIDSDSEDPAPWLIYNAVSVKEDDAQLDSDATIMYVADMVAKSQMSHQEFLRMFSGNLCYYAWKFDRDGDLVNTTDDYFKRLGGLVSTGSHNILDIFPDIWYTCAEMTDTKLLAGIFEPFKKDAYIQDLRKRVAQQMYAMHTVDGKSVPITVDNQKRYAVEVLAIVDKINSFGGDVEKLEKELKKLYKDQLYKLYLDAGYKSDRLEEIEQQIERNVNGLIQSIQKNAQQNVSALENVNTTDGATFISDKFYEMLLRAIGKWDDEIAEAFLILRSLGDYEKKPITELQIRGIGMNATEAYNIIYNAMIGTQKYTAFGTRPVRCKYKGKDYIRNEQYFDKTAYFIVFDSMATGHMKAVIQKMKEEKVDVLKTNSGIKVGGRVRKKGAVDCNSNTFKQWDEDPGSYDKFKFTTYKQSLKQLRKQFNTDPKDNVEMTLGSQYQKVVMLLLHAGQKYTVDGKELDATDIRDEIMDCYKKIADAGKLKHDLKFYKKGELDVEKFLKILSKQIEDRGANDQLRKYLSVEELKDGKKRIKLPLAALPSTEWIQSIVVSDINKDIIDVNTPGLAFYQRPAWAMEGTMSAALGAKFKQKEWGYTLYHGAQLEAVNEIGSMDVVLSIDFFNYLFPPRLKNQTHEAKKAWLIKNGIISGFIKESDIREEGTDVGFPPEECKLVDGKWWHNARTNIIGYRIPTQAPSSIHAMRCVDVVVAVRDTIIMPNDITAITGSDFDIDKFFLSTFFYNSRLPEDIKSKMDEILSTFEDGKYLTEEDLRKEYKEAEENGDNERVNQLSKPLIELEKLWNYSHLTKQFDSNTNAKEYYCNRLLDLQIALLTTNDKNMLQLQGSIDVDKNMFSEVADEIRFKHGAQKPMPFDHTALRTAVRAKRLFSTFKQGIGPFALNNNNYVFTLLYDVEFADSEGILKDLNLLSLHERTDKNGYSISSWISGLITIHVDGVKDPIVTYLGINEYSYNLTALLVRTGFGKDTLYFLTQPIMEDIYSAYDEAAGVYNQKEGIPKYRRTNDKINAFITEYLRSRILEYNKLNIEHKLADASKIRTIVSAREQYGTYFEGRYGVNMSTAIRNMMNNIGSVNVLKLFATTDEQMLIGKYYDIGLAQKIQYEDLQALVAIANLLLLEKARSLSDLVQYTKIDTKKHGKTVSQQLAYLDKMFKLKASDAFKNVDKMLESSFILHKTELAINTTTKFLSTQVLEATPGFRKTLNSVVEYLNSPRRDEGFMSDVSDMIIAKLRSSYFFDGLGCYCERRGINPRALLLGDNLTPSIFEQLQSILNELANVNSSKYWSVRDSNGRCNNYLLNNLVPHTVADPLSIISKKSIESVDADDQVKLALDDWTNAQFIKAQNIVDNSIKTPDMQLAWEQLLNDPELSEFAEQLVVYAFMTSAANGTGYDLFKYLPYSWITGECDALKYSDVETFADYTRNLINKLQDDSAIVFTDAELDEMASSFISNDNIVRQLTFDEYSRLLYPEGLVKISPLVGAIHNYNDSLFFDEQYYPKYFKIPQSGTGEGAYALYKFFNLATRKTSDGHEVQYPVYTLIKTSGGVYSEGLHIYSMGIGSTPTVNYYFARVFENDYAKLGNIRESYLLNYAYLTPGELLNFMLSNWATIGEQVIIPYFEGEGRMQKMLQDLVNSNNEYEGVDEYSRQIHQKSGYNLSYESKWLRLGELTNGVYTPIANATAFVQAFGESSAFGELLKENIERARLLNSQNDETIHLEFYKKHSSIEYEDDSGLKQTLNFYNPTITVSLPHSKTKGFFEINARLDLDEKIKTGNDVYNKEYSIHFKTYHPVMEDNTKYAEVPLTDAQKTALMQAILKLVPIDGKVSIYNKTTKGGEHLLKNLYKYVSPETGQFARWGEHTVEDNVVLPIWQKVSSVGSAQVDLTTEDVRRNAVLRAISKILNQLADMKFFNGVNSNNSDSEIIAKTIFSNIADRDFQVLVASDTRTIFVDGDLTGELTNNIKIAVDLVKRAKQGKEEKDDCDGQ